MSDDITIPSGKHNAKFEILDTAGGKIINASYWTYSARTGFHAPYTSFAMPIEVVPILIDWLTLIDITHCK